MTANHLVVGVRTDPKLSRAWDCHAPSRPGGLRLWSLQERLRRRVNCSITQPNIHLGISLVLDEMVLSQITANISLCCVHGSLSSAISPFLLLFCLLIGLPSHHSQQSRAGYPFKNHLHLATRMEPAATCRVLRPRQPPPLPPPLVALVLSGLLICYAPAVASTPGPLFRPRRRGRNTGDSRESRKEKPRAKDGPLCIFV